VIGDGLLYLSGSTPCIQPFFFCFLLGCFGLFMIGKVSSINVQMTSSKLLGQVLLHLAFSNPQITLAMHKILLRSLSI
jgi:hypothetical protein